MRQIIEVFSIFGVASIGFLGGYLFRMAQDIIEKGKEKDDN